MPQILDVCNNPFSVSGIAAPNFVDSEFGFSKSCAEKRIKAVLTFASDGSIMDNCDLRIWCPQGGSYGAANYSGTNRVVVMYVPANEGAGEYRAVVRNWTGIGKPFTLELSAE